jgi:hypothetical protein
MPYTVNITETNFTSVTFDTKEDAQDFIEEPDYDLCRNWTPVGSKFDLVEDSE